jgi:hypothetical protein
MNNKEFKNAFDLLVGQLIGIGEKDLADLLSERLEDLYELPENSPVILSIKKIQIFSDDTILHIKDQPSYRLSILNNVNNLYIALDESEGKLKELANQLFRAIDRMTEHIVVISRHQLKLLDQAVNEIVDFIASQGSSQPIFLLELPIGNSIPCRLLESRLRDQNIAYETLTIALLRNDSKTKGITRRELFEQKLGNLNKGLLVYMDEWLSGTNFSRINELLAKFKNLRVLPVGLLAHDGPSQPGFNRLIVKHDKFAKNCGIDLKNIRYTFPALDFPDLSNVFIWGEYDKLSGYTKTEFAGDFFYSIDKTVRAFIQSPQLLDTSLNFLSETDKVDKEPISEYLLRECSYFIEEFAGEWEETLARGSFFNNVTNPVEVTKRAHNAAKQINGYKKCEFAINAAIRHLFMTDITPQKIYHFEGLVPLCIELKGRERLLHESFLEHCSTHIK